MVAMSRLGFLIRAVFLEKVYAQIVSISKPNPWKILLRLTQGRFYRHLNPIVHPISIACLNERPK